MIIDCVSDLHGHFPKLEGGDLLIVAGDHTRNDSIVSWDLFFDWLALQKYSRKVFIGGNHDNHLEGRKRAFPRFLDAQYLCDSGIEFIFDEGDPPSKGMISLDVMTFTRKKFKIWGMPWSLTFPGMNPKCKAFTLETEDEMAEKCDLIPSDTDILITHMPPFRMLDKVTDRDFHAGSVALNLALHRIRPKLHVFGHIHEGYGMYRPNLGFVNCPGYPIYVNASHVNERYEPVNKPIRIEL